MNKDVIGEVLSTYKTIAVIGLSREPEKDSFQVAKYMQKHGYRIVPVNPFADEILGEKSYKSSLTSQPRFRRKSTWLTFSDQLKTCHP